MNLNGTSGFRRVYLRKCASSWCRQYVLVLKRLDMIARKNPAASRRSAISRSNTRPARRSSVSKKIFGLLLARSFHLRALSNSLLSRSIHAKLSACA